MNNKNPVKFFLWIDLKLLIGKKPKIEAKPTETTYVKIGLNWKIITEKINGNIFPKILFWNINVTNIVIPAA